MSSCHRRPPRPQPSRPGRATVAPATAAIKLQRQGRYLELDGAGQRIKTFKSL